MGEADPLKTLQSMVEEAYWIAEELRTYRSLITSEFKKILGRPIYEHPGLEYRQIFFVPGLVCLQIRPENYEGEIPCEPILDLFIQAIDILVRKGDPVGKDLRVSPDGRLVSFRDGAYLYVANRQALNQSDDWLRTFCPSALKENYR